MLATIWSRALRAMLVRCWHVHRVQLASAVKRMCAAPTGVFESKRTILARIWLTGRCRVGVNEDFEDMGSSTFHLCKRRRVQSVSKWGSSQGSIKTWVLLLVGC